MNLRDIKKDIDYVLSAFIEDCTVCVAVNPKTNDAAVSALMEKAIDLYNELRDKVNVKAEGSKKAYFNALRKEVLEKTDALYTELSAVVSKGAAEAPAEEKKPAAKKAPAKKAAPAKKEEAAPAEEKKPAAKKAPAKKAAAPKAEKAPAEKKPAAKKAPAKKAAAKKSE
ncbi:MAG: hypothetical protein J5632_03450 [Bacteroidales bacterium]|nr:hypothetical protein [Bacteroidales bacterium]